MHPASDPTRTLSSPAPTLHQRRMHLGRTANRAIAQGLITDFIRTAGTPARPSASGYALQHPDGTWSRASLKATQATLDALLAANP